MVTWIPFNFDEVLETGFYVSGTSGSGKTTLAKHLVRLLQCNNVTVLVLDTSQAWTHNSPITNVEELKSPLQSNFSYPAVDTVFDMSRLKIAERFLFANAICQSVMDSRVDTPDPKALPWIFLIFEEAQLYLPNGCMRSLRKYGSVLDVVTVGRNYNVRFGIISQFPANIDKAPVKICQQRYFGWSTEKNDISYIKSFLEKKDVEEVKKLQKLEFVYQCRGRTEKFKIDLFDVKPKTDFTLNGQTVKFDYDLKPSDMYMTETYRKEDSK
jgi:DNA helicase HerA-like ATPase